MDEELGQIQAFRRLSPRLATSGQPEPPGIDAIGRSGFKQLINLATFQSPGALVDEAALAERAGLRYLHLPIDFETPELEQAARLFEALDGAKDEPVFVHCAKNMRVSALLSAYRMVREGVPCRVARADLLAIWQPNQVWRTFVANAALRALPRPIRWETERLVLRDAELGDADDIDQYASDPEVVRHMFWGPNDLERTREVLHTRLREQADPARRAFELMIVEKASGRVVGGAGLRVADGSVLEADLGYVLARAKWGQGIVPEACAKLFGGRVRLARSAPRLGQHRRREPRLAACPRKARHASGGSFRARSLGQGPLLRHSCLRAHGSGVLDSLNAMSTDPLKDRFDGVDRDGDGAIDEAEFARLLDALGAGYSDPQVRAAFTDIDRDGTGRIELEEFRTWWTSH